MTVESHGRTREWLHDLIHPAGKQHSLRRGA
jgi:hypothetical protein